MVRIDRFATKFIHICLIFSMKCLAAMSNLHCKGKFSGSLGRHYEREEKRTHLRLNSEIMVVKNFSVGFCISQRQGFSLLLKERISYLKKRMSVCLVKLFIVVFIN